MSSGRDRTEPRWRFVEYLRAFAALAVAGFHFEPYLHAMLGREPHAPLVMGWGFGGVDLFFIISGFVVWPATWKHEHSHPRDSIGFLLRRMLRVYTPYWAILVIICSFGLANASADLVKSALLFPQPVDRQVLPVAWTLVLEIIFYAFTFLLLFLPGRFRFKALCGIGGIALLGNILPLAIGMVDSTQMQRVWSWVPSVGWFGPVVPKYVLSLHLLEFVVGAGIAELARNGSLEKLARHLWALWSIALLGFGGALLAALLAGDRAASGADILLQRFAISAGAASLLFIASTCTEVSMPSQRRTTRLGAVLAWLGSGSYMIYLLHNVVLGFAAAYGLRAWCESLGALGAAIFSLWFVAMIVLMAWIGNRIELPLYHRLVALLIVRRVRSGKVVDVAA